MVLEKSSALSEMETEGPDVIGGGRLGGDELQKLRLSPQPLLLVFVMHSGTVVW